MLPGPFTKGSVKVARNLTLGECAAECSLEYLLNQFSCYAYEYARRERTCLMTNITTLVAKGGYLGLRTNSAMDYYERPKGSYENLFRPYPNQVLERDETYFAVFRNKTLEKCALFCLMETRKPCMSFSYSESKQACGLSSVYYTADNGQTLRRSTEYNHYQYYTTWPCNATIPWNYSPRAIASPYFPYASITDVNCHVIIEASEGKQVDLQFSTFYTKGSLCGENGGISVYDGSTNSAPLMSNLCSSDNFVDRRYQSSTGYLYVQFSTGSIPMAFKGVYDFIEVDMCKMAPCQNGGSCISTSGTYYCDCAAGYTGSKCEANIDECASNPCYLGGQCIDRVNGFECKCPDLLGGPRCDVFVGLCHMKPCQNGAKCSPRGTASYVCACPDGFTGQNCTDRITDPCDIHPCENGAQCVSNTDRKSFECQCLAGFTGSTCETDIDECASSPCLHHFKCHDLVNDYRCDCPPILGGKNCELFLGGCSVRPCVHGQCRPAGAKSYTCQCEDGYKGDNCDESFIDFCDPDPCDHGACASSEQGPSCTCDLGYTGFLCDLKIDYCDDVDCHQGECVSLEDDFRCTCLPGYEGRLCNMTINHCKTASCNSGFCINTLTSYFCVCRDGHTGTTCETTPTDECSKTCVNGTCVLRNNTAHCVCDDNFTGTSCDVPIEYCIASPCSHGQCESVPGGYSCTCDENYTGTNCDDVIDDCFKNKCVYGFCQGMENGYRCLCGQGYHGDYCDLKEGETTSSTTLTVPKANVTTQISHGHPQCSRANCRFGVCDQDFTSVCVCYLGYKGSGCEEFVGCDEHNPCNHGNCSDVNGGYGCSCEEGYSGKNCEIDVTDPDPCASVTCQNGGMCYSFNQSDSSMGYQCVCFPGNHGGHCEFSNACLGDVCKNGTCAPIGNGFRCEMTVLSGSSQYPTSVQLVTESSTVVPVNERSDITCEADSINVFIPEVVLAHVRGRNITWRQDSCDLQFNGTHYVGSVLLSSCGTTVTIREENVTFSNDIIVHTSANNVLSLPGENDVTFGEDYETVIPVECIYPRENRISSSYEPVKQNIRFFEKRYGELDLDMHQYSSDKFDELVAPDENELRQIPLDSEVFMRIGFEFDTQDLLLDAKKCIATSTPSPADVKWHPLIEESCPVGSVRLLSSKQSPDVRFAFRAFDFRQGSTSSIYIHCEVSVCGANDVDCKAGCQLRHKRAASGDAAKGSHLVSMGPFVTTHGNDKSRESAPAVTSVFAVVCLVVAVAAVVVAAIGWTRKSERR